MDQRNDSSTSRRNTLYWRKPLDHPTSCVLGISEIMRSRFPRTVGRLAGSANAPGTGRTWPPLYRYPRRNGRHKRQSYRNLDSTGVRVGQGTLYLTRTASDAPLPYVDKIYSKQICICIYHAFAPIRQASPLLRRNRNCFAESKPTLEVTCLFLSRVCRSKASDSVRSLRGTGSYCTENYPPDTSSI